MTSTPEDRIRNVKLEELLGERGKPENRAARLSELTALRQEVDRLTKVCESLAKRLTVLE